MENQYIESIKKQFEYYKTLGEKTFEQISEENLFWKYNEPSNSIANIVCHLSGNMLSRWTDFLTTDGEKVWRNREAEFEGYIRNKAELLVLWHKGWDCLFKAIQSISDSDLKTIIYIRNEPHTILEAINRQLAHYPYHIGQIVFIGKLLSENWVSLSIPKGNSVAYNTDKFSKPKQ